MKLVESFFISLNWLNFWPLDRLTDCYTMQESESQEGRKEGEGGQPAISLRGLYRISTAKVV